MIGATGHIVLIASFSSLIGISGERCRVELDKSLQIFAVHKLSRFMVLLYSSTSFSLQKTDHSRSHGITLCLCHPFMCFIQTVDCNTFFYILFQMSAEEILAEQTEDEPAADGLNEVVQVLTPYLQDKNKVSEFAETLKGLGIETLSDVAHLKQTDVPNFILVIRFRESEGVMLANKAKNQPGKMNWNFIIKLFLQFFIQLVINLAFPSPVF